MKPSRTGLAVSLSLAALMSAPANGHAGTISGTQGKPLAVDFAGRLTVRTRAPYFKDGNTCHAPSLLSA